MISFKQMMVMGAVAASSFLAVQDVKAQGLSNYQTLRESKKAVREHKKYTRKQIKSGKIDKEILLQNTTLDFNGHTWNDDEKGYKLHYISRFLRSNTQNRADMHYDITFMDVDHDGRPSKADTIIERELYLETDIKQGKVKYMKLSHTPEQPERLNIDVEVYQGDSLITEESQNRFFATYNTFIDNSVENWPAFIDQQANVAGSSELAPEWGIARTGPMEVMKTMEKRLGQKRKKPKNPQIW